MTLPVVPSIVSQSPSCNSALAEAARFSCGGRSASASQPATHGLPMPRATTAACEVAPPFAVSTPRAAIMPCTSSGVVSTRTRIVSLPCSFHATASSAVNTICPVAAPGEALSPLAATAICAFGIDARVEELIERLGVDHAERPCARRSSLRRPYRARSSPPLRRCACRCASAA